MPMNTCGYSREVRGKRRSGAAENAHHGIQFPPTILQVRTSHRKIRDLQSRDFGK